jgi:hypothetical protein
MIQLLIPRHSPASYPYSAGVVSRFIIDSWFDRRDPLFGRQRRQAAAPEHQAGNDGSSHEDQGRPQERRRVAVEQS